MKHNYFFGICFALNLFFSLSTRAQDKAAIDTAAIKTIAEKACECTREIRIGLPKDSIISGINGCITAFIMQDQMMGQNGDMKKLLDEALAAKKDTVVGAGTTLTIVADKNFDEIQQYMQENCARVKTLMSTNDVKRDNSMSEDPKALQYYNAGIDFERYEQYNRAIDSYKKAVKADDKFAFAWDNMGLCYRKLGKYKDAISCYQKSYKLQPLGTTAVMNMGVAYTYMKEFKQAAKTYELYIATHPEDPEGYFGAGKSYFFDEDYYKGVDNMFKAYLLYKEVKSPYVSDAAKLIEIFYTELKQKGKEDIFMQAAKNNSIEIKM